MLPRGVIITRPEPGLSETATAVAQAGWLPVMAPALRVRHHAVAPLFKQPAALLLTSGQAVAPAARAVALSVPVFAVGERTAQKARTAGFGVVWSANGNAQALEQLLVQHCAPGQGSLLLFSGAGQGLELAAGLRTHGFKVVRRVAYRAEPMGGMPASVGHALQADQTAGILFFSAQSAVCWLQNVPHGPTRDRVLALRAVVISHAVAIILHQAGWRGPVEVAATPDSPGMMGALGRFSA